METRLNRDWQELSPHHRHKLCYIVNYSVIDIGIHELLSIIACVITTPIPMSMFCCSSVLGLDSRCSNHTFKERTVVIELLGCKNHE